MTLQFFRRNDVKEYSRSLYLPVASCTRHVYTLTDDPCRDELFHSFVFLAVELNHRIQENCNISSTNSEWILGFGSRVWGFGSVKEDSGGSLVVVLCSKHG